MNRRDTIIALVCLGAVSMPVAAFAQQQTKVRRIGFLDPRSRPTPSNPDAYLSAFVQGMGELGYVEGKNLVIEWRFADGNFEYLPGLATELIGMKLEVIVSYGTPATQAIQQATRTIPIVAVSIGDPVVTGLVENLARPGGNITGPTNMLTDLGPKQIDLLKNLIPALSRVAVLVNPGNAAHPPRLKIIQAAAQQSGIRIVPVGARTPEEIERAFAAMTREHAEAVIVAADALFVLQRSQIAELAVKHRLPSMSLYPEDAMAGSLMSYGANLTYLFRRGATYVDKILKGAKPSDLPVEQPTAFEMVVNLRTAKTLGLTIPQSLLLRADRIIE